ncbi:MAG: hypothetical protein ACRD9R_10080 [Pyrinomonadaceae bacterium]
MPPLPSRVPFDLKLDSFDVTQIDHLLLVSEDAADVSGQDLSVQIDVNPFSRGDEFQADPQHQEPEAQTEYFAVGIGSLQEMRQREG